jgi:nucleoside phosphorylase
VHHGLIVSGSLVIKDGIFRNSLNKYFDNEVFCIEMEAAGLMNNFPCLVIRGISDYADSHKNDNWQEHAAAMAAACAKELLRHVSPAEVEREPPAKEVLDDS